jgi:hypothetical protein
LPQGESGIWHRRHALQIACALPDTPEDGLIILRLATRLVVDFLAEPETTQKPATVVKLIGGNKCA